MPKKCMKYDMAAIEMLVLKKNFDTDSSPHKVNLGIVEHFTDLGTTWGLRVVRKVEKSILDYFLKYYLDMPGLPAFKTLATEYLFGGNDHPALKDGRVISYQVLGRLGGMRIIAEFLKSILNYDTVYFSAQFDESYRIIFHRVGYTNIKYYKYWNSKTKSLDCPALLKDLSHAPENAIVVFMTCGHIPTSCDPTTEQWMEIAAVVKERNLFPIFDSPFLGLCTGDFDLDVWPVRYFVQENIELVCLCSFSYTFGLHNDCIELMIMVTNDPNCHSQVKSNLRYIISTLYKSPPSHGANIVANILQKPDLLAEWKESLRTMVFKLNQSRELIKNELDQIDAPGNWDHVVTQKGMFCYTGLNPRQVHYLNHKYHIYMPQSGKMNICGVTPANYKYIACAFKDAVTNVR